MERLWKVQYADRLITASRAAAMIQNGDSFCCGAREPAGILSELGKRKDLTDAVYYAPEEDFPQLLPNMGRGLTVYTSFMDGINREYIRNGRMQFIPCGFSGFTKVALENFKCRAAITCVSAPNKDGFVSFGNSADMMADVCRAVPLAIAEINDKLPFVHGDNVMHVSEFDYIVEGDGYPLNVGRIDDSDENREIYKAIGGYLSELVEDEATLEVGIGRLNSSAMMYLENAHDLGVHTEIYGDLLMNLTKKGLVTNRKKSLNPGVSVCTQVVGSQELFDYVKDNLEIRLDCCNHVLTPAVIAQNNKMTAINNAVQVDLLGQANAEFLKGSQYSGMGGIGDFATGAVSCPDGKSIIVIESVTKNGKYSKIVPYFEPGTPVSLSRTMVEYVVSEYGIAVLAGKSVQERARELVNIAHPAFREELEYQAKEIGILN